MADIATVSPRVILIMAVIIAAIVPGRPAVAQGPLHFLRSLLQSQSPPPSASPQELPPLPVPRPQLTAAPTAVEPATPSDEPRTAGPAPSLQEPVSPQPEAFATPLPAPRLAPDAPPPVAAQQAPAAVTPVAVAPSTAAVAPPPALVSPARPPSACRQRLTADIAVAPSLDPIDGEGECDVADPVRLETVVLKGGRTVALSPPATLGCEMAEAVTAWLREDVAPALQGRGALKSVEVYDALSCRPRNRVPGAKMSEHGKGNAIDIRALVLADGTDIRPTDVNVERPLRARLRESACARFTTVLGPGSDGYHEEHIHLDLAERHNGYRLCHWELDPPPAVLPLPPPRPLAAATDVAQPATDEPK